MPPKKRKGEPKKAPSPGVLVKRTPGEGTIEANELLQVPEPYNEERPALLGRILAGDPATGYQSEQGPRVGEDGSNHLAPPSG